MCNRREEFDSGGGETKIQTSTAQETLPSYFIDGGKKELLHFKINLQQLCLCGCREPRAVSELLRDKRMLRVGKLKSRGISG